MIAQELAALEQGVVVQQSMPPSPVVMVLVRWKLKTEPTPELAGANILIYGTHRLRGVLDQDDAVAVANRHDAVRVRHVANRLNDNHRLGPGRDRGSMAGGRQAPMSGSISANTVLARW